MPQSRVIDLPSERSASLSPHHPNLAIASSPWVKTQDKEDNQFPDLDLTSINEQLANASAEKIIEWGFQTFGDRLVMSTSFGIQAAVMLHLVTRIVPNIPVVWIDTGYLPAETYTFAEELTQRLNLNFTGLPIAPQSRPYGSSLRQTLATGRFRVPQSL